MILEITPQEKTILNYLFELILQKRDIKISDVQDISITITKKNGSTTKVKKSRSM